MKSDSEDVIILLGDLLPDIVIGFLFRGGEEMSLTIHVGMVGLHLDGLDMHLDFFAVVITFLCRIDVEIDWLDRA